MKPLALRSVMVFIISILAAIIVVTQSGVTSASTFTSVPAPREPQPSFLPYHKGGAISCGAGLSAVKIIADSMYTKEGGSEFFCTPTTSLPTAPTGYTAWEKRGYLIGVYPFPSPLSKPISITFEIDAARLSKTCASCWSVQYYNPATKAWYTLPTTFSAGRRLVSASITKNLPRSNIKNYTDRFLVMLFTRSSALTPTPTHAQK